MDSTIDHYTVLLSCHSIILRMDGKSISQIFAENIVRYRKKRGFSQYDLANQAKISRSMISHYEIEGMIPPNDRLQVLADTLEVPVSKLFEDNADKIQPTTDLTGIDPRSIKKLKDILSLPAEDRNDLYRILNKMVRKNQLERQNSISDSPHE